MVKHTQTIRRQQPTNCLSVFDHFVRLALKGLKAIVNPSFNIPLKKNISTFSEWIMCASFRCSVLEIDPESIYYPCDLKYYTNQVPDFFLFDKHEWVKWHLLVCNPGHYII